MCAQKREDLHLDVLPRREVRSRRLLTNGLASWGRKDLGRNPLFPATKMAQGVNHHGEKMRECAVVGNDGTVFTAGHRFERMYRKCYLPRFLVGRRRKGSMSLCSHASATYSPLGSRRTTLWSG
jgi:hypothetical protein